MLPSSLSKYYSYIKIRNVNNEGKIHISSGYRYSHFHLVLVAYKRVINRDNIYRCILFLNTCITSEKDYNCLIAYLFGLSKLSGSVSFVIKLTRGSSGILRVLWIMSKNADTYRYHSPLYLSAIHLKLSSRDLKQTNSFVLLGKLPRNYFKHWELFCKDEQSFFIFTFFVCCVMIDIQ